jgi:hypothetical protein
LVDLEFFGCTMITCGSYFQYEHLERSTSLLEDSHSTLYGSAPTIECDHAERVSSSLPDEIEQMVMHRTSDVGKQEGKVLVYHPPR